jgi:hypothetical protein
LREEPYWQLVTGNLQFFSFNGTIRSIFEWPIFFLEEREKMFLVENFEDDAPLSKQEQLEAEIAKLKDENKNLKKFAALSLKVSQKGALSVYGLGRFPVTLYRGQWERLLDFTDQIKAFLDSHGSDLK